MPRKIPNVRHAHYSEQEFAYDRFKPNGRLHIVCPQCGAAVLLWEDLSKDVKSEVARLAGKGRGDAAAYLRLMTQCYLGEAKAAAFHL